jgi:uncharacterized protein (TIGR00730 family)
MICLGLHERKALEAELSDGFIALPCGIGTLEETFEIWTWAQLGHQVKPCALFNVEGFCDGFYTFPNTVSKEGFLRDEHRNTLISENDPKALLAMMAAYIAPPIGRKWIARTPQRSQLAGPKSLFLEKL